MILYYFLYTCTEAFEPIITVFKTRKDDSLLISKENTETFTLTEQLHHSIVSGEMLPYWKYQNVQNASFYPSLHYAVSMHDFGWQNFDKQPFWNDQTQRPYSFVDFPMMAKLVIYQYGVEQIEKENPYAALLCSRHYQNFFTGEEAAAAKQFVQHEEERQLRLKKEFPNFDEARFLYHFGLLNLLDGISLFAAITEFEAGKKTSHPFFKDGLEIPDVLGLTNKHLTLAWLDEHTVGIDPFPFEEPFSCVFKQKELTKESIARNGFLKTYENQQYESISIHIVPAGH